MNDDRLASMKPRPKPPKPGFFRGAIVDVLALVGFLTLVFGFLHVTGPL